jgi:hypothetical protein
MERKFPFYPKSNVKLHPGDFWGIPLNSGRFACGRVLELPPKGIPGAKTSFLAGLLDWVGNVLPTFDSIAGSKLIEQGDAHIKTITENEGLILGNRPLELDNIEPLICKAIGQGTVYFLKGYSLVEFTPDKPVEEYPNESTWGYQVIKILANKYLDR